VGDKSAKINGDLCLINRGETDYKRDIILRFIILKLLDFIKLESDRFNRNGKLVSGGGFPWTGTGTSS
jgi:hypothetical protein